MAELIRGKHSFVGGVHPADDGKALTADFVVSAVPLLESYQVLIHQNIGAIPELVVTKNQVVKKGELLARASAVVSASLHSPTSGVVEDIVELSNVMGIPGKAVKIKSDGLDQWGDLMCELNWRHCEKSKLLERIRDAGIVGMGGAAFPAAAKLAPPPDRKIDTLIINGAECEPYLTADHRIMVEKAEQVVQGAAIMGRILGVSNILIAVEDNKPEAIENLLKFADEYEVKIVELRVRYPQGSEKQLIYSVCGRTVPAGKLPMDVGCVVQNAGTAWAVAEAVIEGKPSIERVTTVSGTPICEPGNYLLRIGTPLIKAIEFAGGVNCEPGKVIVGGPMMGFAQKSFETTVTKNCSGILLLKAEEVLQFESDPCIRCGRCVKACPMRLAPGKLSLLVESEKFDLAKRNHVFDCLECGACSYVCPSRRPLVQHFKRAKAEIRNLMKK